MENLYTLDLHLFDGEGGATPAGNAAATGGDAQKATTVLYGAEAANQIDQAAPEKANQAEKLSFRDFLKANPDYESEYKKSVEDHVKRRFKAQESILQRQKALEPVLGLLAQRYGVAPDNVEALARAIEDDEELYAQEAADKGVSVEQLKRVKQLERENQGLQRAMAEQQRRQAAEQKYAEWTRQAEEAGRIYPGLDFEAELANEDFLKLLRAGVDVRAAYEVIHRDDIIGGAMRYTAQQVAQKVASDIQARSARPPENGAGAASATVVRKPHAADLTREDVLELARRAKRGITTTFG